MAQTYLSLPRFNRLEYLFALLNSYEDDEFDETRALQAIQREIQAFELKKARALRRQRPRTREGTSTLIECLEMARHLDLVDRNRRLKSRASLVLDPNNQRSFLLQSFWQIYPRISQVTITTREAGPLELPFYNWDSFRKKGGNLIGLDMDRPNFEVARDFATQLQLINWYPIDSNRQLVYSTACVGTHSELLGLIGNHAQQVTNSQHCLHTAALELGLLKVQDGVYLGSHNNQSFPSEYLVLEIESDQLFIKDHKVPNSDFEQVLWTKYLELVDMVPMAPVLYPSLRNQVCATLRLSDKSFDQQLIALIRQPQRLNIHPLDGILSYAANLSHLGKFLPPETSEGNFIVYLKLERRNA